MLLVSKSIGTFVNFKHFAYVTAFRKPSWKQEYYAILIKLLKLNFCGNSIYSCLCRPQRFLRLHNVVISKYKQPPIGKLVCGLTNIPNLAFHFLQLQFAKTAVLKRPKRNPYRASEKALSL